MNVRTKLQISQSLNVLLVLGFAAVAVVVAQRFDYQLRRADLAYEQRQTKTMLAVQAFHYMTAIGDSLFAGRGQPGEIELARRDVRETLRRLATQAEEKTAFLGDVQNERNLEERERIGKLEAGFSAIDSLVDRMVKLRQSGAEDAAHQLHQLVEQRFEGEVAETLAAAMADEQREVAETNAEIAKLGAQRVDFLVAAGLCALAISLGTGMILNRSISRPLKQLTAGVRALKAGSLHHRVESRGADEFALLASQFNQMAERLEDRERRLLSAQSELENQVAQRTAELEAANQRLKYLDRQRLLFLSDISHELRTPVTILRGEAEVTLRLQTDSPEAYRETLVRIAQQAEQMGRLIEDLLFLVRSESDTVTFDRQRVDLQEVVADAVQDATILANSKGMTLASYLPNRPIWVSADARRLRQAILIAIDNAIKYSKSTSAVEISLTTRNDHAVIKVLDHGVGVPPEDLPHVFERFYRLSGTSIQSGVSSGSGLGLPIAKWIVEKHNGAVSLSSMPGESTELVIELPRLDRAVP